MDVEPRIQQTMAAEMKHDRSRRPQSEDEEDPVENMIKKTGCIELHYAVQVQYPSQI